MQERTVRIALMGLGNVSLAFLFYLHGEPARAALRRLGLGIVVTGVATARRGNAISVDGLDIGQLFALGKEGSVVALNKGLETKNAREFIKSVPADILVEATPATEHGEPGTSHIFWALCRRVSVVSANKSPIAWRGRQLTAIARRYRCSLRFGATVLAGRYFFGTAASCNRIQAVLNATANSILTLMLDEGLSFEDGVRRAQALGIAERDPARDTSGYDTAYKMVILANALMGAELMPADVLIRGIEHVTGEALRKARARGRWIHLMGETWKERENVYAQVEPKEVDDPFFVYMRGTAMGVRLERRSGSVELKVELAPGEELMATAEAIFDDIVAVARERHRSH